MAESTNGDTAILDRLEKILREEDAMTEFWFDRSVKTFWAGDQEGDTLREALMKLVTESDHA